MKTLSKVLVGFVVFMGFGQFVFGASVPDDVVGDEHETAITYLYDQGIVSGYPDGTFRPDYELNRAELIKFVLGFVGDELSYEDGYGDCFPDVKDEWFAPYVCYAKMIEAVSGYPDGTFKPANKVNKVEAVKILMNAYQLTDEEGVELPYTDLGVDEWYMEFLRAAYSRNLFEVTSGKFYPAANMTRGQISEMMYRLLAPDEVHENKAPDVSDVSEIDGRGLLSESDFEYIGAIRLPVEPNGGSAFAWGGWAMALNPNGDSGDNSDDFPGSLYVVGHDYDQMVAEVTIPEPLDQRVVGIDGLNYAEFLQPFTDITEGMASSLDQGNGYRISGLQYLEAQGAQDTDKLYWTARFYYNVDGIDHLSHGMSELDFSDPQAQGLWRLGDYHASMTAGYIFTAPTYFANKYLEGKRLISGLMTAQGVFYTSQGPAFFAYAPWQDDPVDGRPSNGAKLDTTALAYFPYSIEGAKAVIGDDPDNIEPTSNFPDFQIPDMWGAASWVYDDTDHAIVVVGHRSMAPTRYGEPESGDCEQSKGYHGDPYEPRFLFYDPTDLAAVAEGSMSPDEVIPYKEWNPADYMMDTCEWNFTGAGYDSENKLFYVLVQAGEIVESDPIPVVYVFKVK